ncbi:MAG: type II toxin-antitoxin system RelE/ParE family toxin [Desulfatiglandales bacterium]
MKKKYEVIWANAAENDLLKILEYIAQSIPGNALKVLKKIKKQVSELYHSPERCRIVPELYEHGITQYREMIIKPWRIMYRVHNSSVYVLSVLDSRQNIEDILLKRYTQHLV